MHCRIAVAVVLSAAALSAQARGRVYSVHAPILELDGRALAVQSFAGGALVAEVAEANAGPGAGPYPAKHIANVRPEPLVVTGDPVALAPLYTDFLGGGNKPLNLAVSEVDLDGKVHHKTVYANAVVIGFELESLDAAQKDTLTATVKLQPEQMREEAGAGEIGRMPVGKERPLGRANFRVAIPGVETSRISKVEGIAVTSAVVGQGLGAERQPRVALARRSVANCELTYAIVDEAAFTAWQKACLVENKNDAAARKAITIEFLGPNLKDVVFKLEGRGAFVVTQHRDQAAAGAERALHGVIELCVEQWTVAK